MSSEVFEVEVCRPHQNYMYTDHLPNPKKGTTCGRARVQNSGNGNTRSRANISCLICTTFTFVLIFIGWQGYSVFQV